jgi:hypothetical protein
MRLIGRMFAVEIPLVRGSNVPKTTVSIGFRERFLRCRSNYLTRSISWAMIGDVQKTGTVSSVGRAPALQAGCHRFESCTVHTWNRTIFSECASCGWRSYCHHRSELERLQLGKKTGHSWALDFWQSNLSKVP